MNTEPITTRDLIVLGEAETILTETRTTGTEDTSTLGRSKIEIGLRTNGIENSKEVVILFLNSMLNSIWFV